MPDRIKKERLLRFTAELSRDWRIRTFIPVIVIHLIAFAALYGFMYHFASTNLQNTHKFGASILLDQFAYNFQDMMGSHEGAALHERMEKQAKAHRLVNLNVYDGKARPIVSTHREPTKQENAVAAIVLMNPKHPMMWVMEDQSGSYLFGVRVLRNDPSCKSCHAQQGENLGVIQMGIDLTASMATAKERVRQKFTWVGIVWMALLLVMFWLRTLVIGRPLAQMQRSLKTAGNAHSGERRQDLDALADRLHETVWGVIEKQRVREEDIARQMVRAEQLAKLGELAAGLTHEIKNPLAGISAALEMLGSEERIENRQVYDQMISELRRVSTTVDRLLTLAKPQPPQRSATDLARVVREVSSLFEARARRNGVRFAIDAHEPLPLLQLDPSLIAQLLVNLLTNSLQATERGGMVRVFLAPFPRQDGVVLVVADTGCGIPPEQIEQIFDPFFTTKEDGTGLGLPICRQIVEQHAGTITVESEPGQGTKVVVLLAGATAKEKEDDGAAAAC